MEYLYGITPKRVAVVVSGKLTGIRSRKPEDVVYQPERVGPNEYKVGDRFVTVDEKGECHIHSQQITSF